MSLATRETPASLASVIRGRRVLFAASTGGHLAQLHRFSRRFGASDNSLWVTFRSAQSESLLENREVRYTDYIAPREARKVVRLYRDTLELLEQEHFDFVISTGAAMGAGVLAAAKRRGVPAAYIESVSRLNGPSLTGRIVSRLNLASTYTQHEGWASERWALHESVLRTFNRVDDAKPIVDKPRIFVTLGTIRPYRFDSLVDGLLGSGLPSDSTVWQLGETTRQDLPGEVHTMMEADAFQENARSADLVITHSGVGTVLQLLEWGVFPVVVPRVAARGEHVDDHQLQIADFLSSHGLAHVREATELDRDDLLSALGKSVTSL